MSEFFCLCILICFLEESVVSGKRKNADAALGIMQNILGSVPAILKNMKPSDFLPLPCLRLKSRKVVNGNRDKIVAADSGQSEEESNLDHTADNRKRRLVEEVEGEEEEEDEEEEDEVEEEEDEEEEEEEEEGDEELSYNSLEPILYHNILPTSNHKDCLYRMNPLVRIISSQDISKYGGTDKSKVSTKAGQSLKGNDLNRSDDEEMQVYIVHSGFGNDTYESILRQAVVVPRRLVKIADRLVLMFSNFQIDRQQALIENLKPTTSIKSLKRGRIEMRTTPCEDDINTVSIDKMLKFKARRLPHEFSNLEESKEENEEVFTLKTREDINDTIRIFATFVAAGALTCALSDFKFSNNKSIL